MAGHDHDGALPADMNWSALADPSATTAIYMPRRTLERLLATGIERGLAPDTPAVAVVNATRPGEEVIRATAATLADAVASSARDGPILVMLGEALRRRSDAEAVRRRRSA
jgi:uroporphyrin-III C-methyltransferase/precorrin-2 dehydrogenase/sirohydrochlorin ferrochelatase